MVLFTLLASLLALFKAASGEAVAVDLSPSKIAALLGAGNEKLDVFDGIGGISGGGATSRLLPEYPEEVSAEILDFLFKPGFGASLQLLKVEIGGDSQSTDGSESSHMHSADDLDLTRGYEWWILSEAKKRNPELKTYGLPWAFPSWISDDDEAHPFKNPEIAANYTVTWVVGAKEKYGIMLDYMGIWNEKAATKGYTLALRKLLDEKGFKSTQIVSADGGPRICTELENDSEYKEAVSIIGLHYPSDQESDIKEHCHPLGIPVWSSEESSSYDDLNGAACWGRVMASHYVLQGLTANLMWNLVGSFMHGTLWYGSSMLTAVQPWSGYYESKQMPVVWATAHYTQFIKPGWKYLPPGDGSGELEKGGYYMTLLSPDGNDLTIIIVKISRDHAPCTRPRLWNYDTDAENVTFKVDLKHGQKLYGRYSNLEADDPPLFEEYQVKVDENGMVTVQVPIGALYTLSTVGRGFKGKSQTQGSHRPSNSSFPLPYFDDFSKYKCRNCYARYLTDQMGAFEIQAEGVLRQMAPRHPVSWQDKNRVPVTVVGMTEWEDVKVSTKFRIPSSAPDGMLVCMGIRTNQYWHGGVHLCVSLAGWAVHYDGPSRMGEEKSDVEASPLATGSVDFKADTWYSMSIGAEQETLFAELDGNLLLSRNFQIRKRDNGFVALGSNTFHTFDFAHLKIEPVGNRWSTPKRSFAGENAKKLQMQECTPNGIVDTAQQFDLRPNWQIVHVPTGLCMDASNPAALELKPCNHGDKKQQFRNDYTVIRNERRTIWNEAGSLLGDGPGKPVYVSKRSMDQSIFFKAWSYFPNTMQLRSQLIYDPKIGPPHCLTVVPAHNSIDTDMESTI